MSQWTSPAPWEQKTEGDGDVDPAPATLRVGQTVRYTSHDVPTGRPLAQLGMVVGVEPAHTVHLAGQPEPTDVPERARVAWLTGGEADGIPADELEPIG